MKKIDLIRLKNLTTKKFINRIENLKGNDLECAKRKVKFIELFKPNLITDYGEDFNNWMSDCFAESCEELNMPIQEIQEIHYRDYQGGYFISDCFDYVLGLVEDVK